MAALAQASKRLKQYSGVAASAVLLAYVLAVVNGQELRDSAAAFPFTSILTSFVLIAMSTLFACIRYAQVLSALGLPIPLRLAIRANILGIVGGLMFFQIVGQTLARSAILARNGVDGPAVLVANILERLTATIWLALLGGVGFAYLFSDIALAALGGSQNLVKFVAALMVALAAASLVTRRLLHPIIRGVRTRFVNAEGLRVGIISLLVHQATLFSYLILASTIAPDRSLLDIAAASAVVMLAASMPISFAGWGVRELSAVYAYHAIGIPTPQALAISIAIGLLSLAAVFLGGLASQVVGTDRDYHLRDQSSASRSQIGRRITRISSLLLPLLAAVLIYFNAKIPIAGGALNFNLADPIAICGGLIFLFRYARVDYTPRGWRAPYFNILVLLGTASLTLSLIVGFTRFGFTDWAFFSRYVGWFVLLSYVATGALIVGDAGEAGRRLALDVMLVAGLGVCAVEIVATVLQTHGLITGIFPNSYPSGATQNVNAYAAQLCILLTILLVSQTVQRLRRHRELVLTIALSLVLANVYLAHSRTGYVVALAVVGGACLLEPRRLRTVAVAFAGAALLVSLSTLPPAWLKWPQAQQQEDARSVSALSVIRISDASSDAERFQTIKRGLELWQANSVFGAGLGAYAEETRLQTGRLLVIHNTTVWMLAELGLLGSAAMIALPLSMASYAWRRSRGPPPTPTARVLLLTLLTAALFQMPHDVFYQRIFWLVIGICLLESTFATIRNATPRAG